MSEQEFRTEKDSIGTKNVPEDVYYGVQSYVQQRTFILQV